MMDDKVLCPWDGEEMKYHDGNKQFFECECGARSPVQRRTPCRGLLEKFRDEDMAKKRALHRWSEPDMPRTEPPKEENQ